MSTRSAFHALLFVLLLGGEGSALAGPQDTRVGETRIVYAKQGTVIRADAVATAAPVATLPQNTSVVVEEVRLPWVRVHAAVAGQPAVGGWLRAFEAIEPQALAQTPAPAYTTASAPPPGTNARDVSAAGRQFTSGTERGYRASRQDMERGYQLVDRMEAATGSMVPADSISFLMEGGLGRRGRDYQLPPRVPPQPDSWRDGGGKDAGDVAGRLVGEGLRRFGGLGKKESDAAGKLVGGFAGLAKQMNDRFTPEQEYYLGRAVAATALAKWGVDRSESRRRYVREIGDAIVRVGDPRYAPANFGGYHFEVLDCEEVNGVSGPGGFVLVTRGAVEACRTEDELAGILCHELAHVSLKHGEQTLRQSQKFQGSLKAFAGALGALTGADDSRLGGHLVDLFTTAVGELGQTAVSHGYGRELEFAADAEGTNVLFDVFYDWGALRNFLVGMPADPHAGATHAPPAQRAQALEPVVARLGAYPGKAGDVEARLARFQSAVPRAAGSPR